MLMQMFYIWESINSQTLVLTTDIIFVKRVGFDFFTKLFTSTHVAWESDIFSICIKTDFTVPMKFSRIEKKNIYILLV